MPRKPRLSSVTDAELAYIAQRIRETLGPEVMAHMASLGLDVETTLRMKALGELFVDAREAKGLTLKEAAAQLRAPQYRVRDVEAGARRLDPGVLARYAGMLGIGRGVRAWARRYPDLAAPIGLPGTLRASATNRASRRRSAMGDFDDLIAKARKQGRRAGLKRADVTAAVKQGRRRS